MGAKQSMYMDYQGNDNKTKMIVDAANKNTSDILHKYVSYNSHVIEPFEGDITINTRTGVSLDLVRTNYTDQAQGHSGYKTFLYGKDWISVRTCDSAIKYTDRYIGSPYKYITFSLGLNGLQNVVGTYKITFKAYVRRYEYLTHDMTKLFGVFLTTDGNANTRFDIPAAGNYYPSGQQKMSVVELDETESYGTYYTDKTYVYRPQDSQSTYSIDYSYQSLYCRGTYQSEYECEFYFKSPNNINYSSPYFIIAMNRFDTGVHYYEPVEDGVYTDEILKIYDIKVEFDKGDGIDYLDGIDFFHEGSWHPMRNPGSDIMFGSEDPEHIYGKPGDLFVKLDNPVPYFVKPETLQNLTIESYSSEKWIGVKNTTFYNDDAQITGDPETVSFSYDAFNVRNSYATLIAVHDIDSSDPSSTISDYPVSVNSVNLMKFTIANVPSNTDIRIRFTVKFSKIPSIDTISSIEERNPKYQILYKPYPFDNSDYYNNYYTKGISVHLNNSRIDLITPSSLSQLEYNVDYELNTDNRSSISGSLEIESINDYVYSVDSNGPLPSGVTQVTELPSPTHSINGQTFQYIGESGTYIKGMFYMCVSPNNSGYYINVPVNKIGDGYATLSDLRQAVPVGAPKTVYTVGSIDAGYGPFANYFWDDTTNDYSTTPMKKDLITVTIKDFQIEYVQTYDDIFYKYRTTWLFSKGGSGGSSVIANPEGAATSELNKLSVDGSIYSIPSGGSSTLRGLSDVSANTPLNGQILKYDEVEQKWKNQNENTVIPNPQTQPSETLNSVEIDGVTYSIPSGGGGSGSILYGTTPPTSSLGSDGDIYYQYSVSSSGEWTADEEYLVTEANVVFDAITSRNFRKSNAGKAIAVNYVSNSWSGGMLVSQDPIACYYGCEGGSVTSVQSTVVDGITWYASTPGAWVTGARYNSNGVAPDIECNYSTQPPNNSSIIIPLILEEANARNVTEPDSIVATYFKQDGIWLENESGGTEVEGNPQEEATDELTSVKIGDTVYSIPSGGGGGGGKTEALYTAQSTSVPQTITLSKSLTDYDFIIINIKTSTAGQATVGYTYAVDAMTIGDIIGGELGTGSGWIWYTYTNDTTLTYVNTAKGYYIYEICGIKSGGGGSEEKPIEKTVLFDTGASTTNTEITLSDDITNYDELEFVVGFSTNDKSMVAFRYTVSEFITDFPYTGSTASSNSQLILTIYSNNYMCFTLGTAMNKIFIVRASSGKLYKVSGIKYGTGGGGGGGGGTSVIANPTGEATDTLTKVSIDNVIYEISGGGGGGSGSAYSETTLFTGTYQTTSGEITLDDDLNNYDLVIFWTRWTSISTNSEVPFIANAKEFVSRFPYDNGSTAVSSPHMGLTTYDNQYLRVKMGTANNKLFLFDSHSIALARVIGIKIEGSGEYYSRTELFKSSDDNAVWNASGIELSDDIENYDELEIVMGFSNAASDKSKNSLRYDAKWFASTFPYISDANANPHALGMLWPGQGFSFGWDGTNQKIRMWARNGTAAIWAVYGIKY